MSVSMREIGESLAGAVERAERSVVHVAAPRRGSGTAWSEELVVASACATHSDDARVELHDGSERRATVIGCDPTLDVAVLRVEGGGLTPISFAEPSSVKVGHLALALGRPGRCASASLRMVSAIAHDVATRAGIRLARWIETDRAIPAGFSGGPLIDLHGDAIGMSTDALVRGADLVLPGDELARVVGEIEAHGQVRRGWLGVAVRPVRLTESVAAKLGQKSGAVVVAVEPDSPAERAGIACGDVIWAIEGGVVRAPEDLLGRLRARIDATLRVSIVRAGRVEERTAKTIARAA